MVGEEEEEVAEAFVLCFGSIQVSGEKWKQRGCSVDEATAGWSEASQKRTKKKSDRLLIFFCCSSGICDSCAY